MQPAASAGAVFQVESMNGAFHGVITTAGPARHPDDAVARAVRLPHALLVGDGEVGVGAEVPRAAGDDARAERAEQHRHVGALDRGEPVDVRVDQVGEPVEVLARARSAPSAAQAGNASVAAATASSASRSPPRATSAIGCASIGERSAKVASLATRSPPMKCSVETSTPATSTRAHADAFRTRSSPTSTGEWPPSTASTAPLT